MKGPTDVQMSEIEKIFPKAQYRIDDLKDEVEIKRDRARRLFRLQAHRLSEIEKARKLARIGVFNEVLKLINLKTEKALPRRK